MQPGNEPKVQGLFGSHTGAAEQFRGINLADDVGELGSGRESLNVAIAAMPPRDGRLVAQLRDCILALSGDRCRRIFMHG